MDSLGKKIGQLILVGLRAETPTAEERLLCEEFGFGGFVLFSRNCREAVQTVLLCRALWDLTNETPPFIAIDQEGGRVHRLPPPFSRFPAAARIGARNDPVLARRAGRATAAELALAGINLNFAPVLDVGSTAGDPIIGDRAFAVKPQTVMTLGCSWAQGLRDGGIIPCGKHFPGHGAADKDSHLDLPLVEKSLDELKAVDLAPFVYASHNGIEALMTAHVLYPALDAQWPATLSEKIVTGLLRQQLGYGGVIFSDDMEMKAISDRYGVEAAAYRSIRAGVDALLFCHDMSRAVEAWEFLSRESEQNPALRARVDTSYGRVIRLKQAFLRCFSGVTEKEIFERLASLNHGRLLAESYGSL